MNIGLQVLSSELTTQIDSDYRNLVLLRKVSFSNYVDVRSGQAPRSLDINLADNEVVAFKPSKGGNGTCLAYQTVFGKGLRGEGTAYIFGVRDSSVTDRGLGLEVFRDDGSLAYSSEDKPLKIIATHSDYSMVEFRYPPIPHENIAVIMNAPVERGIPADSGGVYRVTSWAWIDADGRLRLRWWPYAMGGGLGYAIEDTADFAIIDVSGM